MHQFRIRGLAYRNNTTYLCLIECNKRLAVVDVKGAVVKNADLTQKLGMNNEPKLIYYRKGIPILYEGLYFVLRFYFILFYFILLI